MQAVHVKIQPRQLVREHGGSVFRVAEHHHAGIALFDDELGQVRQLVAPRGENHVLVYFGRAFQHGLHRDFLRVTLVQPADIHNLAADGGAEHGEALFGLDGVQNFPHILIEAHVQHLVSLIQHDVFHMRDVDAPAVHMVLQAAGRCHHNLRTLF